MSKSVNEGGRWWLGNRKKFLWALGGIWRRRENETLKWWKIERTLEKREWDFKMEKIERTFFDFCGLFQVEKNRWLGIGLWGIWFNWDVKDNHLCCNCVLYIFCATHDQFEQLNIKPDIITFGQHDLFLLEKQLPYHLLKWVMGLSKMENYLRKSIETYIAKHCMVPDDQ